MTNNMKRMFLVFAFGFISGFVFSQNMDSKCYELRIYYCETGRLDALISRFENHTTRLFEKHGMTNVGYWVPVTNEKNALYYILSYPSLAVRDSSWKEFTNDPEWKSVRAKSEESGKIVTKAESAFLQTTNYSPVWQPVTAGEERIFELRTYYCYPGKIWDINERFRNYTIRAFEKHGMTNIAYWNTVEKADTIQPKLVYLLANKSPEAARNSFEKFGSDPEIKKVFEASEANGKIVERIESVFLKPLSFSAIQ
jgi:hypothetical protein